MIPLSEIVTELRSSSAVTARFGNRIGGVIEMNKAQENSYNLSSAALFVIPLSTTGDINNADTGINQKITERFGVIAAIANDVNAGEESGMAAYDITRTVRAEIFKAILGHDKQESETPVYFVGDKIIGLNRSWLWYQYEFESQTRVNRVYDPDTNDTGDGKSFDLSQYPPIETVWADIILSPSVKLNDSKSKDLPLSADDVDQQQRTNISDNPNLGSFNINFTSAFKLYKE